MINLHLKSWRNTIIYFNVTYKLNLSLSLFRVSVEVSFREARQNGDSRINYYAKGREVPNGGNGI